MFVGTSVVSGSALCKNVLCPKRKREQFAMLRGDNYSYSPTSCAQYNIRSVTIQRRFPLCPDLSSLSILWDPAPISPIYRARRSCDAIRIFFVPSIVLRADVPPAHTAVFRRPQLVGNFIFSRVRSSDERTGRPTPCPDP